MRNNLPNVNWKAVESFELHDCGTPLIVTFKAPGIQRAIPLIVDGIHRCAHGWLPSNGLTSHDMTSARAFADTLREGLYAERLSS